MSAHQHFTVSPSAYLSNLPAQSLQSLTLAIHYEDAPKKMDDGTIRECWISPVLVVTSYVKDPDGFAKKVAKILEKHWDDAPDATTQSYDAELLAALEIAVSVLDAADLVWMGSDRAKSAIAKARGRSPQPAANCAKPAEAV